MVFDLKKFRKFKNSIALLDERSSFKMKMYDSGAFFEITNSNGQIHEISYQALRIAFCGFIEHYDEISHYIEWCNQNPDRVSRVFEEEESNFLGIVADLKSAPSTRLIAQHWNYKEKPFRVISDHYFPNSRISVVGKEQSKLLFNAVSRLVYCANDISADEIGIDSQCPFTIDILEDTLKAVEDILQFYDVGAVPPRVTRAASLGVNIIYYGAPGTGKSHTIDEEINEANTVRSVFHADTQNSDFTGCLKPVMDDGNIKYEFRPGPFTNAIINAANDSDNHYWLVIEEINRAPAAAVFGEIFQLLDRDSDAGKSRYGITLSDPDMHTYINDKAVAAFEDGKLKIPGNLSLLATMNSSDQAVMPLDTAFKRRWKFRYIPLDFTSAYQGNGKACAEGNLLITDRSGADAEISWQDFATAVNLILTSNGIPEDRHLGPFFLSDNELSKEGRSEALTGKLFMYLWDDVLRHGMTELLFDSKISTYGQLIRDFESHEPVFNDEFYNHVGGKMSAIELTGSDAVGELPKVAEEQAGYDTE